MIDAPDLDAQVDQAREQLRQAEQQLEQQKSQLALATVTVERYRVLVAKGVFSRQQGDQQEATYASQLANVAAAQRNVEAYQANLHRAIALQSYEQVRAPFDGVVTQRNVDVGALISAAGATSSGGAAPAPQGQTSSAGGTQQAGANQQRGIDRAAPARRRRRRSRRARAGRCLRSRRCERLRILVSVPEGYAPFDPSRGSRRSCAFQEYPGAAV